MAIHPGDRRGKSARIPPFVAAFVILVLAACAISAPAGGAAGPSGTPAGAPSKAPVSTPSPSAEPTEPAPASPLPPSFEGHAAAGLTFVRFAQDDSPVSHVFVVESDGSLRQVTGVSKPDSTGATYPVWSPDGTQLMFAPPKVGGSSNWNVSLVNADGTGERPIAPLQDEYTGPFAWSPDGTRIVFGDLHEVDGPMMWLVDVASGEVRYLGAGSSPRWLPDGRRIVFIHQLEGTDLSDPAALVPAVFLMDLETGSVTEFARAMDAVWSPDGSAVLVQEEDEAGARLAIADGDGANRRDFARGWSPAWSPDASQIVLAYDHNQDALPLLALVDLEGRELWSGVIGDRPSWSPDGTRIAVEVAYPEQRVQVLDARTGDVLWEDAGSQPTWRP
jgi:Tol biopolymer transport system component